MTKNYNYNPHVSAAADYSSGEKLHPILWKRLIFWINSFSRCSKQTQHFKKSEIKSAWKTPPLTPSTALTSSSHQYRNDGDQSTSRNSRNHHTSSRSDRSVSSELRQSSASLSSSRNAFLKNISNKKTNVSILSSTPDGRSSSSSIRLTGDAKTDEDIMAFMKARQELMRKCKLDMRLDLNLNFRIF